jgi:peptidoglycan/xylan/chitin deacetylase (PgdA/CDA1 family)
MRIVSPFLKRIVYPTLSMAGVFQRIAAPGVAILTYHGILPAGYKPIDPAFDGNLVTADVFRRQLRRLKAHYNVIAPEDLLSWRERQRPLPTPAVLLTCDDGLLNNLTDMLPILQEEKLKCLFFVTAASAGDKRAMLWYEDLFLLLFHAAARRVEIARAGVAIKGELGSAKQRHAIWWSWVKQLSRCDWETRNAFVAEMRQELASTAWQGFDPANVVSCRRFCLMTSDEVRQLSLAGMTIGAHSISHPVLSQMPLPLARAEIAESREKLESALLERIWGFAYPFGDSQSVNSEVLALPGQLGFSAAFLNFGGGLGVSLPAYALPRIHITSTMSLPELEAHVSGLYAQLHDHIGRNTESSRQGNLQQGRKSAKPSND